jgi:hypothetical protein
MSVIVDADHKGMSMLNASSIVPIRDKVPGPEDELSYLPSPEITLKGHAVPPLRRYQSAPLALNSPGKRRSIFGKALEICNLHHDDHKSGCSPITPPPRKRSTSFSSLHSSPDEQSRSLMVFLSRPMNETRLEERPHFCPLTQVPEVVLERYPLLPVPLQRFYDGTRSQYLEGMYPLSHPESILKRKDSAEDAESLGDGIDPSSPSPSPRASASSVLPLPELNLTRSSRRMASHVVRMSSSNSDDTGSSSSSSESWGIRKIRFDPRVTVTEYQDDPEQRRWFTDGELEGFKNETVALAQQYLIRHPSLLEEYSKPYLDPVTGTFRKKALFSMLVLKATRSDDSLDELESEASRQRYEQMRCDLADAQVQTILLVNHNKLVLDLFERSLGKIFPKASISCCASGEEALTVVHRAGKDHFDMVVAEDRLRRGWKSCDGLDASSRNRQEDNYAQVEKTASLGGLSKSSPAGSLSVADLFCMVRGMEKVEKRAPAVLIGVSTNPDASREALRTSGADAVWGLPPPRMNDDLRDELVGRLIKKRRP